MSHPQNILQSSPNWGFTSAFSSTAKELLTSYRFFPYLGAYIFLKPVLFFTQRLAVLTSLPLFLDEMV